MKKNFYTVLLILTVILSAFRFSAPVSAENGVLNDQKTTDPFSMFSQNAAGRYTVPTQEGSAVLELIPAFDRLFASVGYYMNGNSLYSYYAAELIPYCRTHTDGDCSESESSFDFDVRLFSNMSLGGNYWPGETRQRITVVPGGIYLSHYSGDGDALISKENLMLTQNDHIPGMMPYTAADIRSTVQINGQIGVPGSCIGRRFAVYQDEDGTATLEMMLDSDGSITFLKSRDNGYPPLLLKGGFALSEERESLRLWYMMSSPSSGTMPYFGCVIFESDGDAFTISHPPTEKDTLLVPESLPRITYTPVQ